MSISLLWSAVAGLCVGSGQTPALDRPSPEARAVAFLVVEVPRWSRENHCFSCHNNGDAARALYEASRAGFRVPVDAMAGTTAWLNRPEDWDHNGGDGPFSDKRLARVAFTAALATATRTGSIRDRAALNDAAVRLARPGRRRLLDARRRGNVRLARGLRPGAGHLPGPREPRGGRPAAISLGRRPRRRLAHAAGDRHRR